MILEINGIEVNCIIGDLPEERLRPQMLLVDVKLTTNTAAARSDKLSDGVDYLVIVKEIRNTLVEAQCHLIENAAYLLAQKLLLFKGVWKAEVRVEKFGSIPGVRSAAAVFTAQRANKEKDAKPE